MSEKLDLYWMQRALQLAHLAEENTEVPVGAALVKDDELIAEGWNQPIAANDPTAHAEIIALRQAGKKLQNYRLIGTTLYVTVEPCLMCLGALVHARIARLVFGAYDSKAGAVCSQCEFDKLGWLNHRFSWQGGVMAVESQALLQRFFQERRK